MENRINSYFDADAAEEMIKGGLFRYEGAGLCSSSGNAQEAADSRICICGTLCEGSAAECGDTVYLSRVNGSYFAFNEEGQRIAGEIVFNGDIRGMNQAANDKIPMTVEEVRDGLIKAYFSDPMDSLHIRRTVWNTL